MHDVTPFVKITIFDFKIIYHIEYFKKEITNHLMNYYKG
jgi:hypothetical protein